MTNKFKIATWNVNSLRVRLPQVIDWLKLKQPDVLALQETKVMDENFPVQAFEELGFHVVFAGQRAYNGMAIISRDKPTNILKTLPTSLDEQKRVLGISFGEMRILNLYVPNGESLVSTKFQYKLQWLETLFSFLNAELSQFANYIILGDFNIAPAEMDIHDPVDFAGRILFSESERNAFQDMLAIGFTDCFRQLNPNEKAFSWWDYRLNAFKRNMGARIDHILTSRNLATKCTLCHIDTGPRHHERPSDHAPVVAEFALD